MENTLKYLESRVASIKTSISKAEDRLIDANRAETERVGRMGWGYGMRRALSHQGHRKRYGGGRENDRRATRNLEKNFEIKLLDI